MTHARTLRALSLLVPVIALVVLTPRSDAEVGRLEISDDGQERVVPLPSPTDGLVIVARDEVPYGLAPDWQNSLRRQVGGLQVADMNGDGWNDVVVGCYISDSYPPYTDWENLIYFNQGGALEADPSWISADEVSTGDVQVAFINDDPYPDLFAANGGFAMSPSVIYWGGPGGPSTLPGWMSAVPGGAWNNYALPFDVDHDGDTDIITANQGNSPQNPYRPLYIFFNTGGVLSTMPGWQSAEASIQNFLAMADYDHNGWEDLAVSKWVNFASGIYANIGGVLQTNPVWTTGDTDSDKGVGWADVDGNGWVDFALGHDPTQLWSNSAGTLSLQWSASGAYFGHSDLVFCDVDRDGDPDLAEDHFSNGQVRIYLNEGGVLSATASWTYDSPTVGTALAFGDLNGDHWPDLVVGNSGEPCVKVFYAVPTTAAQDATPAAFGLLPNEPNPYNPATTLRFTLPVDCRRVDLAIFDVTGRRVATLIDGPLGAGQHEASWRGMDARGGSVASGVYSARLVADGEISTQKLNLIK